ncbi:MAG: acetate kinase [Cardiobacteriaceae bacterium]|nr:acetate kinase [Cardiobacteriaceae bacterium]
MLHYIFVLNCGSSSLKFSVINPENGDEPLKGLAERLGVGGVGNITIKSDSGKIEEKLEPGTHQEALRHIVAALEKEGLMDKIKAVGHRVVHGGEYFAESVLINDDVRAKIADCIRLAPLHNPAHITGIDAAREVFPQLKQVAVFDTAFHQHMPERAYLYALPYNLYTENKIRRYGFHGTSYRYIASQLPEKLGIAKPKAVVAHLGNGASVAAVNFEHSEDTTMGLTPLEGVVHGTRSGDVDPAIFGILTGQMGMSPKEVDDMLWKQSGLLGLSGLSNDCRTIEEAFEKHDAAAIRTMEVYCYRLAKHIAAQMVALGGADAIVFTGGIGENSSLVREKTIALLEFLGFKLDAAKNAETFRGKEGNIAAADSKPVWVIATNEELMIARDTDALSA